MAKDVFAGEIRRQLVAIGDAVIAGIEDGSITRAGQFAEGDSVDYGALARHPPLLDIVREVLGDNNCLNVRRILMKDLDENRLT